MNFSVCYVAFNPAIRQFVADLILWNKHGANMSDTSEGIMNFSNEKWKRWL